MPEFMPRDTMSVDKGLAQGHYRIFRGGPYRVWCRSMKAQSLSGHVIEVGHSIKLVHGWSICVKSARFRSQFNVGCRVTCKRVESPGDGGAGNYISV